MISSYSRLFYPMKKIIDWGGGGGCQGPPVESTDLKPVGQTYMLKKKKDPSTGVKCVSVYILYSPGPPPPPPPINMYVCYKTS